MEWNEEKYEQEMFERDGSSFWRWQWFRPFYIDEVNLDVVASEHQLRDAVCKEGSGKLPRHISVGLYDIMEQMLYRHTEHSKDVAKKVKFDYETFYSEFKTFKFPDDWVFKTETDAMTVGEFNLIHRSKFEADEE